MKILELFKIVLDYVGLCRIPLLSEEINGIQRHSLCFLIVECLISISISTNFIQMLTDFLTVPNHHFSCARNVQVCDDGVSQSPTGETFISKAYHYRIDT